MKKREWISALLATVVLTGCSNMKKAASTKAGAQTTDGGYSDRSDESVRPGYNCAIVKFADFADKESYENVRIPETATVTVNGRQLTGTLESVDYFGVQPFPNCKYSYVNDAGLKDTFETDVNGRLLQWSNFGGQSTALPPVSQEICLQAAKDFFREQIGDISSYQVSTRTVDLNFDGVMNAHAFDFRKYINGVATIDSATIYVFESGEVIAYNTYMLGAVPTDSVNPFDFEKAEETVHQWTQEYYADQAARHDRVEYSVQTPQFLILKDGEPAILYSVEADFFDETGDQTTVRGGDSVQVIVTK